MTVTTQPQDGLYVNNLSPGSVIDVETKNHHYRIEYLTDDEITISGHPRLCPTPIRAQLQGSARGSGTFKPGFVGCGMHLVFRRSGYPFHSAGHHRLWWDMRRWAT